ncbi:MAG: tRNA (guanosine(46)-N7)-methyltransferase TrmB, partial [Clostridia bacterium]|nr:tRNA (guanosine(46)-N7)-methyltransferase TrmB [Clostridia bacterium]
SQYGRPKEEDFIKLNLNEVFSNDNPVFLEIGCGKGGFITELASLNPDKNFVAVEKDDNVMVSALERAVEMGLKNVKFIICSAENLPFILDIFSIDGIYLNFSCPYPKGTYANRRLTNPRFLDIYRRLLKPNGKIIQKTDNVDFFNYSIESYSFCGYSVKEVTYDLYNSEYVVGNIATEYEKKFVSDNKPICRLVAKP